MNELHFTSKLEKGLLFGIIMDDTIFVLNNVYNLNTNSGQVTMLYSDKKGANVNGSSPCINSDFVSKM